MKLSEHFDSDEFACRCGCGFADVSPELIEVLEDLRAYFRQSIKISSGCRCPARNKEVGGETKSKHMEGIAADIQVKNIVPYKVYKYLNTKYSEKYGIGLYPTWVHIDVREEKARWQK